MGILALANSVTEASWQGDQKVFIMENEIDLGEADAATSDVATMLGIAADMHVMNVWCEITEICDSGASTATVGDGTGSADGFDASINLLATVGTITYGIGGTDAYVTAGGHMYSSADTIDLTLTLASGPTTTGKVLGRALIVDLR